MHIISINVMDPELVGVDLLLHSYAFRLHIPHRNCLSEIAVDSNDKKKTARILKQFYVVAVKNLFTAKILESTLQ